MAASIQISLSPNGELIATIFDERGKKLLLVAASLADLKSAIELQTETNRLRARRELEQKKAANFAALRRDRASDLAKRIYPNQTEFAARVRDHRAGRFGNVGRETETKLNLNNLL